MAFQDDLANSLLAPLHEQHIPARFVGLTLKQDAVQLPALVLPPSFGPYVGSMAT